MSLDQPSVVPVDTHVLQIAAKHYGFKQGKGKGMTPAVYAAVGGRLGEVWGAYAGWAQGVVFASDLREFAGKREEEMQEDVKVGIVLPPSPASEGGEMPRAARRRRTAAPSSTSTPTKSRGTQIPPTPESLPSAGRKRKLDYFSTLEDAQTEGVEKMRVFEVEQVKEELMEVSAGAGSMGERVKLRRRRVVRVS